MFDAGFESQDTPNNESTETNFNETLERVPGEWVELEILGQTVAPGDRKQLNWQVETAMSALSVPTPVLVARGKEAGPTLCLLAAIHGDELNGVEMVRRVLFDTDPESLSGTIIGIPIVNAFGFIRGSRYLPDRRDLNRFFPGTEHGSLASRFASALFNKVVSQCDVVVDIHTGSFHRTNLPQLRADLTIDPVSKLSKRFGAIAVLHSEGPSGSLRRAATDIGIPAVTLEAGEPSRFEERAVAAGVKSIQSLLYQLGMVDRLRLFGDPLPAYYDSSWVRAEVGGILFSKVELGEEVSEGELLGTITDPIENRQSEMVAPFDGRVIGMAVNQVVMPGFAAFHIGRATSEEQAIDSAMEGDNAPETVDESGGDGVAKQEKADSVEVISDMEPGREFETNGGESVVTMPEEGEDSADDPADEDPGE